MNNIQGSQYVKKQQLQPGQDQQQVQVNNIESIESSIGVMPMQPISDMLVDV